MRRLATAALIAILVAAACLTSGASGAVSVTKTKAYVRVRACSLSDHTAVFYARMRRVRHTRRMAMRFTLFERPPGLSRFRRVRAPGLGRWRKSKPGIRAFGYSQEVRGLVDGFAYRMKVRYRWYDADHKLLRRAGRTSSSCPMYLPLPNLRVRLLDARPTKKPGVWRYDTSVVNKGKAEADDAAVQLSVDGAVVDTETVGPLAPGESKSKSFNGPACSHDYRAVVDPYGTVAESDEADNSATAACGVL